MISMVVIMMYELGSYKPGDRVYELYQKVSNFWDKVI